MKTPYDVFQYFLEIIEQLYIRIMDERCDLTNKFL